MYEHMDEFDLWLEVLKLSNRKIYNALSKTTDLNLLKQAYESKEEPATLSYETNNEEIEL